MVRLVTQYNNIGPGGRPFPIGRGWDGADGPWYMHIINTDNIGSSNAQGVGVAGHTSLEVVDWLAESCLNSFRLELVYE